MSEPYEQKVVHLPGTTLTPEVLLHRTLSKASRIKAVTVVIQWDDDSFDADWSSMKTSELVMAALVLDENARNTAMGRTANNAPDRPTERSPE